MWLYRGSVRLRLVVAVGCAVPLLLAACSSPRSGELSPGATPSRAGETPQARPPIPEGSGFDPQRVAEVLGPAVATVIVNAANRTGEGSGFVIGHGTNVSYLLTNNHVVNGGSRIQVLMPDGRHFRASIQGADPVGDLAVLRVDDPNLPAATFADSTQLRVGQRVVAIGSPLGNEGSVTVGVISALHRSISAGGQVTGPSESLPDVLQTDAAINPGNSGGPLADAQGRVVGVNTAASSRANNIGFAIPSNLARRIADTLIAGKKPGHPYIGVGFQSEQDALAAGASLSGFGVLVTQVLRGCPAEKAGIHRDDVIQQVDGVSLNNGQTLGGVLQLHNPGDRIKVTVVRGGSTVSMDVTLADRPGSSDGSC